MENLLGQGRAAIDLIVDENSFEENAGGSQAAL